MNMLNWIGKSPGNLNPTQRMIGNLGNIREGETFSQGKTYQLVVPCQMIIPENMHPSNTIQDQQVIFWNICAYTNTYMYAVTTGEKGGHEFEGE